MRTLNKAIKAQQDMQADRIVDFYETYLPFLAIQREDPQLRIAVRRCSHVIQIRE